MTGTNCDLFAHKSSRSYLNNLVYPAYFGVGLFLALYFPRYDVTSVAFCAFPVSMRSQFLYCINDNLSDHRQIVPMITGIWWLGLVLCVGWCDVTIRNVVCT